MRSSTRARRSSKRAMRCAPSTSTSSISRSEEHTSELQSLRHLVCRLLLEKKNLEDTDGDDRADKRTVFYEGFKYITGIEVGFGGAGHVSPPGPYFIPDRDGSDKPAGPAALSFGAFGYQGSRRDLVAGFQWGPDGWRCPRHGGTSPPDGGRPGSPADPRIHCDGGVYRIHPTRLGFENCADGATSPWGV